MKTEKIMPYISALAFGGMALLQMAFIIACL